MARPRGNSGWIGVLFKVEPGVFADGLDVHMRERRGRGYSKVLAGASEGQWQPQPFRWEDGKSRVGNGELGSGCGSQTEMSGPDGQDELSRESGPQWVGWGR